MKGRLIVMIVLKLCWGHKCPILCMCKKYNSCTAGGPFSFIHFFFLSALLGEKNSTNYLVLRYRTKFAKTVI